MPSQNTSHSTKHITSSHTTKQEAKEAPRFSSVLSKLCGSFSWEIVTAHVADGFFWYTPVDKPDAVTKLVPLANVTVARSESSEPSLWTFDIQVGTWAKSFGAADEALREQWLQALSLNVREPCFHPYNSFAPAARGPSRAAWLVDGADYFGAVAEAIRAARREVFIAGWAISPAVYLWRGPDPPPSAWDRLDMLIKRRADEGVQFYVLLWKETRVAVNLGSSGVEARLAALGPNVHVLRHPLSFPLLWSHHQKIVAVDQAVAFIGGLDLTYGRYDTAAHRATDACVLQQTWPGHDYYNPQYGDCAPDVLDERGAVDRLRRPRMPWHDVGVALWDEACRSVCWNFVQRWAHHIDDLQLKGSVPYIVPRLPDPVADARLLQGLSCVPQAHECTAAVVRSLGAWSGSPVSEASCEAALVDLIGRARRFVYIENQYFVSLESTPDARHNRVADAIVARFRRAFAEQQPFHMVVLLPLFPEGSLLQTTTRYVMKFQYDTIARGPRSILGRLRAEFPHVDVAQHLYFASLMSWGTVLLPREHLVANQVYVHSKLCIADDECAMVGSNNINDRSLNGERDTEIAAVLWSRPLARSLRQRLWSEHIGMDSTTFRLTAGDLAAHFAAFRAAAEHNTRLLQKVFGPSFPQEGISYFDELHDEPLVPPDPATVALLAGGLKGHAVAFPLSFLDGEDLFPPALSSEAMLDKRTFQ